MQNQAMHIKHCKASDANKQCDWSLQQCKRPKQFFIYSEMYEMYQLRLRTVQPCQLPAAKHLRNKPG
jgi:hypothetical protein